MEGCFFDCGGDHSILKPGDKWTEAARLEITIDDFDFCGTWLCQ